VSGARLKLLTVARSPDIAMRFTVPRAHAQDPGAAAECFNMSNIRSNPLYAEQR